MKMKEISSLKPDQIKAKLVEFKKEHFNLRFQKSAGQLTNTSRISKVKKSIARLMTMLNKKATNVGGKSA